MLSSLPAGSLRRLGAALAILVSLGALVLVSARPAAAFDGYDQPASFESVNYPGQFLRHQYFLGELTPLHSELDRNDATFTMRRGLNGGAGSVSFESVNYPGYYLRHQDFRLKLAQNDGTDLFRQDATFTPRARPAGAWSFEAVNFPGFYIRHAFFHVWLAKDDGSDLFAKDSTWQRRGPANQGGADCANARADYETTVDRLSQSPAEQAVFCLINEQRAAQGVAPLAYDANLAGEARRHASDAVRIQWWGPGKDPHANPERGDITTRIGASGYCPNGSRRTGENAVDRLGVSEFPPTPRGAVNWWMQSKLHHDTLLNPALKDTGVGVVVGSPEKGVDYTPAGTFVQDFGACA